MNQPFNQLSDAEAERLAVLAEECAEVIQVVGKILRHGYNSHHPEMIETNRDRLEMELGHVFCIGERMQDVGDLDSDKVVESFSHKKSASYKYLHHQ